MHFLETFHLHAYFDTLLSYALRSCRGAIDADLDAIVAHLFKAHGSEAQRSPPRRHSATA